MNKVKYFLVLLFIIGITQVFPGYNDYKFSDNYIKSAEVYGWKVYKKVTDFELLAIYSWFKQPIARLFFINEQESYKTNDNQFFVKSLMVIRTLQGGGKFEEEHTYAVDCNNYNEAWNNGNSLSYDDFINNYYKWEEPVDTGYSKKEEKIAHTKEICDFLYTLNLKEINK